jgi:hypothetical protein
MIAQYVQPLNFLEILRIFNGPISTLFPETQGETPASPGSLKGEKKT